MYDRILDLLIENQFASRPGGDKSGRRKGMESVIASQVNKERKPRRERMPSTARGLRGVIAKRRQGRD